MHCVLSPRLESPSTLPGDSILRKDEGSPTYKTNNLSCCDSQELYILMECITEMEKEIHFDLLQTCGHDLLLSAALRHDYMNLASMIHHQKLFSINIM